MSTTERPIVDFDHHSAAFHDTRYEQWAEMRKCPVAFNPNHGGFWVVSGYDEVNAVSRDEDTFSSRYVARADRRHLLRRHHRCTPHRRASHRPGSPSPRTSRTPTCAG